MWDPEEEEWVYVPEDEIPLGLMEVPPTGDSSQLGFWTILGVISACALAVLHLDFFRKRKNILRRKS